MYIMIKLSAVGEIQNALKDALYEIWKNCMNNEWLSPTHAQSRQLTECYVQQELTWVPNRQIDPNGVPAQFLKNSLNSTCFQEILSKFGPGNKRILVRGM